MKGLQNKVAVITGATSGIGLATALRLAEEGVNLVLAGRRADRGAEIQDRVAKKGIKAIFKVADVTREDNLVDLFGMVEKEFGQLHFAFNNAGVESDACSVEKATGEEYNRVMDTNVKGVLLSIKHEVPLMRKADGGVIVNTSSIAGLVGLADYSIYVASKHAVLGLTKSAALELAKDNIRVNAVSPGAVETELFDRFVGHDDQMKAGFAKMHPLGRVGKPEEIAASVAFLFSDDATFITGQSLTVDGGYTTA
jgi:NAD(P)-dependent dehydrogenase (short-subunit alcohol dehydrogenase family)